MMITYCEDIPNYEDIYLWIDDHRFQISVEDYVFEFNNIAIEPSADFDGICIQDGSNCTGITTKAIERINK